LADGTAPKYQSRYLVGHTLATAYELRLRQWTFRIRRVVLGQFDRVGSGGSAGGLIPQCRDRSRVCQYENSTDRNFILDRHPEAENV
jgi:glycine/D-amino acid oxidase-like deaminating enzyme